MAASFFFCFCFLLSFAGIFLVEKTTDRLEGFGWLLLSLLTDICLGSVALGVLGLTPIPIGLTTTSLVYLAIGLVCGGILLKRRKMQRYRWDWATLAGIVGCAVVVGVICLQNYGARLNFVFRNSDSAVHFRAVMYIVRDRELSDMWFARLFAATLVEVFEPFLMAVNQYKAFILADTLAMAAGLMMYFVLIREQLNRWWKWLIGIGFTLLYCFGYPLTCYYFGFYYWGVGVLLLGYLLQMARYYRTQVVSRRFTVLALMVGCGSLIVCYSIFAPAAYIALFLGLVLVARKEGKVFSLANVLLALKIFLLPCVIGLYYCYFQCFTGGDSSVSSALTAEGGIYREWYIQFLLLAPLLLYWLLNRLKDRQEAELALMTVCFVLFTGALLVLVWRGQASTYYYYKLYYPLWLLCFAIAPLALCELFERQRTMAVSLTLVAAALFGLSFGNVEDAFLSRNSLLSAGNYSDSFFDLYYFNRAYGQQPSNYDARLIDLANYVLEELDEEDFVPLLSDAEGYHFGYRYWWRGITDNDSNEYYNGDWNDEIILERLENGECDYLVVMTDSSVYQNNAQALEGYPVVFETDFGKVLAVSDRAMEQVAATAG
jgi:hypothetical protein